MIERELHTLLIYGGFLSAAFVFCFLLFFTAPYGRHVRAGWGPTVPNHIGWILMETPAVLSILYFCLGTRRHGLQAVWVLLGIWQIHYLYRTYIFPFLIQSRGKRMPLLIVLSGMGFNVFNGYLNGRHLAWSADNYPFAWLGDPRFLVGMCLFVCGFVINIYSDNVLIHLRRDSNTGYAIPRGGLYRWISCPNYFGELIEWCGWALLTWSMAGLVFAVWTAANLVPRALSNHRWYKQQFQDYPSSRKAIVPLIL